MNLRRTAFIAALLLTIVRVHSLLDQVRALQASFQWFYVPALAANFLFVLPFLGLLLILSRGRAVLSISNAWRRTLLGTVFVYGALFAAPAMFALLLMLRQDWQSFRLIGAATVADAILHWVRTSDLPNQAWAALGSLSELAFCVFLVALFTEKEKPHVSASSTLREAAALATITAGLVLVLAVGGIVYTALSIHRTQGDLGYDAPVKIVVRSLVSMVPRVCEFIAAYIIFKGQPRISEETIQARDALPQLPVAGS